MAVYRPIQISYWQDTFVISLTPEEKFFYLYLMTNSKTTQCGIYELPIAIIKVETGYNEETIKKLIQKFIDYKKIKYESETGTIYLVNWIKYNQINSINICKCVVAELKNTKNKLFITEFIKNLPKVNDSKFYNLELKGAYKGLAEKNKGLTSNKTPTETPTETETKTPTKTPTANKVNRPLTDLNILNQDQKIKTEQFETWWKFYNRKDGKKEKIIQIFSEQIVTEQDYKNLITATRNYNGLTENRELKYLKVPINFLLTYKDFIKIDN